MTIRITYRQPCRYFGQALTDLQGLFNLHSSAIDPVELAAGTTGVSEVDIDGDLGFPKDEQGRLPRTRGTPTAH